jgi:hypothetical protein
VFLFYPQKTPCSPSVVFVCSFVLPLPVGCHPLLYGAQSWGTESAERLFFKWEGKLLINIWYYILYKYIL